MRSRTAADLVDDLRRAGVVPGDNLIVHSSLKSVGPVETGPATVVDALLETVGPTGSLMMPTFTYSLPMWNCDPFDVRHSSGRVGAIPEEMRQRPEAHRSFHPTHSVAVIGPDAEQIIANHLHATPIGEGSPFARMARRGGKILMLGTHQDTNSSLHYCEVAAGSEYIHVPFTLDQDYEIAWFINERDQIEYTKIYEVPGCSRGFRVVEAPLRDRQLLQEFPVGEARCQLLDAQSLIPAIGELLAADPAMMLCHIASCAICPKRRAFLLERGVV